MTPVQPEELSALLDGELSAERAAEIERQMVSDPALRAEFELLSDLDAQWRTAARTAVFTPGLVRPTPQRGTWMAAAGIVAGLVALRIVVRVIDVESLAYAMQAVVLAVLLAGLVRMVRADQSAIGRGVMPLAKR
jgi:anti-sigma factor RsiW